jgi:hypothetical protein
VHGLLTHRGAWQLSGQLCRLGIELPIYFRRWVNIKRAFEDTCGVAAKGMANMLQHFGIHLVGTHHRGIGAYGESVPASSSADSRLQRADDARNICSVLEALLSRGARCDITSQLRISKKNRPVAPASAPDQAGLGSAAAANSPAPSSAPVAPQARATSRPTPVRVTPTRIPPAVVPTTARFECIDVCVNFSNRYDGERMDTGPTGAHGRAAAPLLGTRRKFLNAQHA